MEFDWVKLLEVGRNIEDGLLRSTDDEYAGYMVRCPPGMVDPENPGKHAGYPAWQRARLSMHLPAMPHLWV